MPKLDRSIFEQPTLELAKNLLGCRFMHVLDSVKMAGIIVETEAYLWEPTMGASDHSLKRDLYFRPTPQKVPD